MIGSLNFLSISSSMKSLSVQEIMDRINQGLKFGLFEANKGNGGTYYFEDGRYVDEKRLWEALRTIHSLGQGHGKTLKELCPENYAGIFNYSYNKHNWKSVRA